MMNCRERTKEIVWYIATAIWLMIAFSIAYIWVETLISHQKDVIKYLSLELALLVLLALIAGFEIAFTDLRDKDPLQLDPKLRRLLTEMQQNESVVYDAREWFGVVLIVLISLICELDPVFEPHFDILSKFVRFRIDRKTWRF